MYCTLLAPWHTLVVAVVKLVGATGRELTVIAIDLADEVPQLLVAVTLSVPEVAALLKFMVINLLDAQFGADSFLMLFLSYMANSLFTYLVQVMRLTMVFLMLYLHLIRE